jgi:hypothetical protein
MERTPTRFAAAAIAGVALFASTAVPANATVFEHFTFDVSDQDTFDDCGFTIASDWRFRGSTVIRTVRDTQTLFLAKVGYHGEEIFTNPENGEWFRITYNAVTKEGGPVEEVSPGVYIYTVREAGVIRSVWDSSGQLVARDRGVVTSRVTFDSGGDDVPGGEELSWDVVGVSGPHPLLDVEFCDIATDLIG